ncbi:hypothetical protein [Nocardioides sp. SYSU DS0663]|uniref:hypothetical protein n=1 Tax=Nocardioides sp. SYSU DS0663 TaxID=3416445 RepID=UPI003F4C88AC
MALFSRRRTVQPQRRPDALSPWPFVGLVLMAMAFFLYAASGLIAPAWAVVVLLLVWFLLLLTCFAWWSSHPRRLPWVGVGAMLFWFLALNAGGAFLGWTA